MWSQLAIMSSVIGLMAMAGITLIGFCVPDPKGQQRSIVDSSKSLFHVTGDHFLVN